MMLWQDDYRLNENRVGEQADSVFKTSQLNTSEGGKEFEQIIKKQRVDVVLAGNELMKLMNTVSTKSRAMFLKDYDKFFKELDVGSTSRPMLYTYLGIQFADQSLIESWYKPIRERFQAKIVNSCRSLIKRRQNLVSLQENDQIVIDHLKHAIDNHLHLAYLVHKSNLNLFMLDTFLMLCARVEPERLKSDLENVHLSF